MQSGKLSIASFLWIAGIIFVVALFLHSALAPARHDQGRPPSCQDNLKRCAQALKMYTEDYDGQLPSSRLVSGSSRWNTRDFLIFGTTLGKYPPAGRRQTIWQALYDNIREKEIPFCPSDPKKPAFGQSWGDRTEPSTRTSYWYKLVNDKAWYGVGCAKPRRSLKDFACATDQIAFYEHLGWHTDNTSGLYDGVQINASFMDTHVETIVLKNATSGDEMNCAANSDGEPMYYNCAAQPGFDKTQTGPAKLTDPAQCYDKL